MTEKYFFEGQYVKLIKIIKNERPMGFEFLPHNYLYRVGKVIMNGNHYKFGRLYLVKLFNNDFDWDFIITYPKELKPLKEIEIMRFMEKHKKYFAKQVAMKL